MTKLEHSAWYTGIIANVYAVADKPVGLAVFAAFSVLLMVASVYERKQ